MKAGRLEAFSDGVIAVIITIMVLEFKAPERADWDALRPLIGTFLSYVLSFVFVGIYWNNHHHMLQSVKSVSGGALWANLHLLFWISLIPFGAAWMGNSHFASAPVLVYGVVLLGAAIAYTILVQTLIRANGPNSAVAQAIGDDRKGKVSLLFYVVAIALACFVPLAACACYVAVACIWLVPDRRFERVHRLSE